MVEHGHGKQWKEEGVNLMDFDRSLIRQRNDELLQEVRVGRLEKRPRADRERRSRHTRGERGEIILLRNAARFLMFGKYRSG